MEQVDGLPAGRGPGRVAPAEPDAGHGKQVGAEAVVEREPGEDAEHQRADGVDDHGAERERVAAAEADVVDQQRPEDGAGAAGQRDQQRQAEVGEEAHDGTSLLPSAVADDDQRNPADDGGRQIGEAGGDVHRPWPTGWPRRPRWSTSSILRGGR